MLEPARGGDPDLIAAAPSHEVPHACRGPSGMMDVCVPIDSLLGPHQRMAALQLDTADCEGPPKPC
jgi:hypothetical protein